MRYVFISDVHGEYEKMLAALESVNFNKETDTIVSLGDPFDRGFNSKEVLKYLMDCPHRILVWGNHDRRLADLLKGRDYFAYYDQANGVVETLRSFTGYKNIGADIYGMIDDINNGTARIGSYIYGYFKECVYAVEFEDLIATHAWLPYWKGNGNEYRLLENWRDIKADDLWYDCSWGRSDLLNKCQAYPDKKLIIGHWHAWRLAEDNFEKRTHPRANNPEKIGIIDCETFEHPNGKLIAIDGCANYDLGGRVNAYVYESDCEPILYPAR